MFNAPRGIGNIPQKWWIQKIQKTFWEKEKEHNQKIINTINRINIIQHSFFWMTKVIQ